MRKKIFLVIIIWLLLFKCLISYASDNVTTTIKTNQEDKNITEKLIQSGHMLGIPLLDHIITNGEEYYSFYDEFKAIF